MLQERDFPPVGPGQMLERVIGEVEGKITQEALAGALRVSRFTVNQIINGRRSVTADMAVRLGHVLGTSAEMWLNAQSRHDLYEAKRKLRETLPTLTQLRELEKAPSR